MRCNNNKKTYTQNTQIVNLKKAFLCTNPYELPLLINDKQTNHLFCTIIKVIKNIYKDNTTGIKHSKASGGFEGE